MLRTKIKKTRASNRILIEPAQVKLISEFGAQLKLHSFIIKYNMAVISQSDETIQ